MAISMTGFGRGEVKSDNYQFLVECKTINHRYCDINMRLPRKINFLEDKARNFIKDFVKRGYDPIVYKLFSYSCHYRNKLNFTWEGIEAASKSLERLKKGYIVHLNGKDEVDEDVINAYEERFHKAINDDLNMPAAMGVVWEVVRQDKKSDKFAKLLLKFDTVLGLKIDEECNKPKEELPEEILELIEERKKARENKEWNKSDELRDIIKEKGYEIKDTKDGMEVKKI